VEAWPAATIMPPGTVRQHGSQPATDLAGALARLGTPLPVLVAGSALKLAVLRALVVVPLGATITYAELARAAGAPRAVRAAARVMSTNVVPLVLPCHRVVPTGGGTGRYGWGDEVKRQLLALERTAMEATP
jgi:O-6-methylguanine DNA methyltransferase